MAIEMTLRQFCFDDQVITVIQDKILHGCQVKSIRLKRIFNVNFVFGHIHASWYHGSSFSAAMTYNSQGVFIFSASLKGLPHQHSGFFGVSTTDNPGSDLEGHGLMFGGPGVEGGSVCTTGMPGGSRGISRGQVKGAPEPGVPGF